MQQRSETFRDIGMGQYLFGHENHSTGANIFFFDEQKGTAVLKLFWGNVFWGNVTKGIWLNWYVTYAIEDGG